MNIKPLLGFNWTYASGLENIEKSSGDIFQFTAGIELLFRNFGIEYCFFIPEPSFSIHKNKEFNNDLDNHRFGIIYHFFF